MSHPFGYGPSLTSTNRKPPIPDIARILLEAPRKRRASSPATRRRRAREFRHILMSSAAVSSTARGSCGLGDEVERAARGGLGNGGHDQIDRALAGAVFEL